MKTRLSGQEFVKSASVDERGRRIIATVTVMDSTSLDAAKGLTNLLLEGFSDSQLGYYDFELNVKKEDEKENNFPIQAIKQHNKTEFSWTKDREKTEPKEEEGE